MSKVGDILTALNSSISAVTTWDELDYCYDLEANSVKSNDRKFGVRVGSSETVTGPMKAVTKDQIFEVVLMADYKNKKNDSDERQAILDIYDELENIDLNVFQKKLGLPSVIDLVSAISTDAPEKTEGNSVYIVSSYLIKYRNRS